MPLQAQKLSDAIESLYFLLRTLYDPRRNLEPSLLGTLFPCYQYKVSMAWAEVIVKIRAIPK